jgi:hypothetical protein
VVIDLKTNQHNVIKDKTVYTFSPNFKYAIVSLNKTIAIYEVATEVSRPVKFNQADRDESESSDIIAHCFTEDSWLIFIETKGFYKFFRASDGTWLSTVSKNHIVAVFGNNGGCK